MLRRSSWQSISACAVFWLGICCATSPGAKPASPTSATGGGTTTFRLELRDPALPDNPPRAETVTQTKDERGFPKEYSMFIVTEVCTDKKCKLVEATLYWNSLGYFDRIEVAADKPLTKKEHVPFDAEDYTKLQRILRDPNSILGQQSLAYLATPPPSEDAELVDGWSGATPVTFRESVVKDAAYTSWVMWRWANGEIVPKLREFTERDCSVPFLKHLLASEDRRDVDYALKYVRGHYAKDDRFVEDVFRILETGDREHVTLALGFLSEAVPDKRQLHARLIESCCRMKSTYSPMILAYFTADPDLPDTTLDGLSDILGQLPYFQVHLTLRLFEQRKYFSKNIEADVAKLLDGDDFFIARRAFEHLVEQSLSDETRKKVDAFREKYRDRL